MTVFVRWQSESSPGGSVESRIATIGALCQDPRFTALAGSLWYRLAGSRTAALQTRVTLDEIATRATWRASGRPPTRTWRLALWNGEDFPFQMNLSATLFDAPPGPDTFVLSGLVLERVMNGEVPTSVVYEAANAVSLMLGGRTVVGSHELTERARELGVVEPEHVVHAIFDGTNAPASEGVPLDAELFDDAVLQFRRLRG